MLVRVPASGAKRIKPRAESMKVILKRESAGINSSSLTSKAGWRNLLAGAKN
jgi:hypothetical protein